MLFILKKVLFLPLALFCYLSPEIEVLRADLKQWIRIHKTKESNELNQICSLLVSRKAFRSLYYFRLTTKSKSFKKLAIRILRIIYRPHPTLRIHPSCTIGPGFFIQHGFETGITADIGKNCWINQHVTIGHRDHDGRPVIEDGVRIGVGARILGPVHIGSNVNIGANAVVVKDVPSNCTVVGVPAYIVKKDGKRVKINL